MPNTALTAIAHIVVCDDEPDIRDTVSEYLQGKGYAVTTADGGLALRRIVDSEHVDVVILDIKMPGEDGLSLARYLHEHSKVAIIMLTGSAEVVDRVVGLEIGADDYVGKPVDLRELLARVKAVLRRTSGQSAPWGEVTPGRSLQFGTCRFFPETHKLYNAQGEEVAITPMESQLLTVFAEHRGRILNRDQLLELAHDRGWEPFDRSIDIRISRLRKKIEPNATKPEVIKTVRGVGYVYS
ncbi:response regulator transcription factor [Mesorhizobium sp. BAC0120]|uniref:response regulator transcription factor n=1 Tax=Mesorhizobium sp. BAC0120 TaxID=3090670 RepID=UPI00298CCFEF|nr:response regulator transcription factor [Mesorhizobium sp. BAC0120]MDW6022485.1 response regulator transcription factor [Mesorhizobium sp. BAC0120]